jgi:hypothetical protein
MHSDLEEFDEISCIRRNNRKVVIQGIFPHDMICPTRETNMGYGLSIYADFSQSAD